MNTKNKFILNSFCFILLSPLLGVMVSGFSIAILRMFVKLIILSIGMLASLFFEVNFDSFPETWEQIDYILIWFAIIAGCIGGFIWSILEISEKWKKFKTYGTDW